MANGTTLFMAGAEVTRLGNDLINYGVKNILFSYYYILTMRREAVIEKWMNDNPHIIWFLDSGAFTYAQKYQESPGLLPPLRQYLQRYFSYIEEYGHRWCRITEPDMDIAGVDPDKVARWRNQMLDRWGDLNITPVWHRTRGIDEWESYLADPRVKTLAMGSGDFNDVGLSRRLIMQAQEVGKPVHGFGMTRINTVLKHLPVDSVDSSVGGESLVWVKDSEGSVECLPIRQLYERWGGGEFNEGTRTLTVARDGDRNVSQWAPLQNVVRHKVTKPFCRLTLEGGHRLTVTGDHSLFRVDAAGDFVEVKPGDLSVGDWVASARNPVWGGEGLDSCAVTTFKNHGPSGLSLAEETEIEFDDTFLRFVGLWLADGSYGGLSIQLSLGDSECVEVVRTMADRYGRKLTISPNGVDIRFSCARLVRVMKELGLRGESHTKTLPKWFWSLSRKQAGELLKGYFSGDGSGGNNPYVTTVSRRLWKQLTQAVPAVIGDFVQVKWSRERRSSFGGMARPSGRVTVSSARAKKSFLQHIGFLQAYKRESVVLVEECRGGYVNQIPSELAQETLFYQDKVTAYGSPIAVKAERVMRRTHPAAFHPAVLSEDMVYLRVQKVEWLRLKEREVFDLSVPGTERFLANGILVHNTSWVFGQKAGTLYIFRANKFIVLPKDKKGQRRMYRAYFRNIGCDPQKVIDDDLYEVRKANILAWRGLAERLEFMKRMGRQTHGLENQVWAAVGDEMVPMGRRRPPPLPKAREAEGLIFVPKDRSQ
jgi:Intein splicing domain